MKIVFFGTPEFAIPSLKKLIENFKVVSIVTVPDKEKGRGLHLEPSPVKKFALSYNIPIFQPENLRDQNFIDSIKELEPDVGVVVAFRILPVEVFTIPKFGTFNLHASLLPKYRGAAPIQWALINGEKETGVTTFFLKEKVDTGNIILQRVVQIEEEDNFQSLHDKLSEIGAELVFETCKKIESGNFSTMPQDESQATKAPKITKEICRIDWYKPAIKIYNLVRGLSPVPGAFTELDGRIIKIFKTKVIKDSIADTPGKIESSNKQIFVHTDDNLIEVLELQLESKKRMSAEEFFRGYKGLLDDKKIFT